MMALLKGVPSYWFWGHENLQNTYIIGYSLHSTTDKLWMVTKRACQRGKGEEGGSALTEDFGGLKMSTGLLLRLVPAEGNMPRTVTTFLHQGLVELPACPRMNGSPAIFTIILEAGNISTEKRSKLSSAASPLTLITQLVVQDIWLNFHLKMKEKRRVMIFLQQLCWEPIICAECISSPH